MRLEDEDTRVIIGMAFRTENTKTLISTLELEGKTFGQTGRPTVSRELRAF